MKIAAVGDNCIDDYVSLGTAYPGGNAVNVAVNCVRAGGTASYVGVVGDDAHGRLLIEGVAAEGVDVSHVHVVPGTTAVTSVELVDGERILGDYDEGVVADFRLTDDDLDFIAEHDLVATALWGKIENSLRQITERGVQVAFDFATEFDHEVVDAAIVHVSIAFFSANTRPEDANLGATMTSIADRGPRLVVVTLGEHGSIALSGGEFTVHGIEPVEIRDTMGAGDSYIGGFLWAYVNGASVSECMAAGTRSSAHTLQLDGAW
jgi:fructoselysine 6-kinase